MALPSLLKTPDEYLAVAIDRIAALGSKLTDFNDGSTARSLFEAYAVMLSQQSAVADQHRRDSYLSTATGDALTAKAFDQGVVRKAAVRATGTIRITRTVTTAAVTIPAGWAPLATVPTPGVPSVTYVTLADAVFGIGAGSVVVSARAVDGGTAGNIAQAGGATTTLLPVNPVTGFNTASDFVAYGPFVDGVDEETDDQLRARVPLAVQGRVRGRREAFLSAALAVAGVTSAQVRQAGESKVGGTVAAGEVYVYFEGSSTLDATVTAACLDAAVLDQAVTTDPSTAVPMTVVLTVFVLAGTDHTATTAAVKAAVMASVNDGTGVGDIARFSSTAAAVHDVDQVVSAALPFTDFRKTSESSGLCHDTDPTVGKNLTVAAADITVTVTDLS